jgi:hypothetical protein
LKENPVSKYIEIDYYLRDPIHGASEREWFEEAAQRPGVIAFDRSGPAEGDTDYQPYFSGTPTRLNCAVGMGVAFIPKD